MGQGSAHAQGRVRVPQPPVPVPRMGGRRGRRAVRFQSPRHRRLRRQRQQPRADRRSVRVVPARPGVQRANQTIPVYPTFNEAYTAAWINDEFKVSDKLTLTLGLRFDYQFARTESQRSVLDVRSEHAEPGRREASWRDHLRGKRHGPHRARGRSRIRKATPGGRGSVPPIASTTRTPSAAATGSTTRAWRSSSSSGSRRSGSRGIPLAPNMTNGMQPAFYLDKGFPADRDHPAAVHRPDVCQWTAPSSRWHRTG